MMRMPMPGMLQEFVWKLLAENSHHIESANTAKPAITSHLQEQSHLSPELQVIHWQLKPQL